MTAEIHQFPAKARVHNNRVAAEQAKRNELAKWLTELASLIKSDDAESEPTALLLVLSGAKGDEVVWKGYAENSAVSLRQAGHAAYKQVTTPYARRGGNFHDRTTV